MKKIILVGGMCLLLVVVSFAQNTTKKYTTTLQEVTSFRDALKNEFLTGNSFVKDSLIVVAENYLVDKMIGEVFPCWYGTPWDFEGMTRIPRQGKIACGYFVTNILEDIGFNIPRIPWAQSASEVFIKKLAWGNIKRFWNKPISNIKAALTSMGDGLYLVGLDRHTGFLYKKGDRIKFIHADYYEPEIGVIAENLEADGPFADSSYRVIGKLFSKEMLQHWIAETAIK